MFRIRMVTFDVTGTLLQFRAPIYEMYAEAGRKHGILADPAVLRTNFRKEYARMTEDHPIFGKHSSLGWRKWWENVVIGTFSAYGKSEEDKANIRKTADYLIDYFQTADSWSVQPGAHQLLQFLKRSYYKLGVISNFDARLHTILKNQDLQQYFDFVLTSYECGYEKPNERIFQEALKLARNVQPGEAAHIGNDVKNDYLAAKSVGWSGMLIQPDRKSPVPGVDKDHVFLDLKEVKNYFQSTQ